MGFSPKPDDFWLKLHGFALPQPLTEVNGNERHIFEQAFNLKPPSAWPGRLFFGSEQAEQPLF
jgi:hypothetical protein